MLLHSLDLNRADAGGVGQRRAGHTREDQGANNVDLGEPALHPPDERKGEVVDTAGDTADIHQVAGHDEHWHGQQRKAIEALQHSLRDHQVWNAA